MASLACDRPSTPAPNSTDVGSRMLLLSPIHNTTINSIVSPSNGLASETILPHKYVRAYMHAFEPFIKHRKGPTCGNGSPGLSIYDAAAVFVAAHNSDCVRVCASVMDRIPETNSLLRGGPQRARPPCLSQKAWPKRWLNRANQN